MFAVHKHKFKGYEHKFAVGEHKFMVREHKISGVEIYNHQKGHNCVFWVSEFTIMFQNSQNLQENSHITTISVYFWPEITIFAKEKNTLEYLKGDKNNLRYRTLMKLFEIGKGDETSISKLQVEDLETITEDKDVQNIILLRKFVKARNTLEYLKDNNEQTKNEEREEET